MRNESIPTIVKETEKARYITLSEWANHEEEFHKNHPYTESFYEVKKIKGKYGEWEGPYWKNKPLFKIGHQSDEEKIKYYESIL